MICDYFVVEKKPLSYMVGSLIPVLEASLVIAVTSVALLGALLDRGLAGAVVVRPERSCLRIGLDSIIVLALLAIGMIGLVLVSH